jgi:hypothetical protein
MIGKETQKLKENSRSHSLEKYPTQMGFIWYQNQRFLL